MTETFSVIASVIRSVLFAIAAIIQSPAATAQLTPGILANDSYWSDGKAEFDIFEAQLMRQGQLRKCELLHILFRERIDPKTLARVDDPKRSDATSAIRMSQIWSIPVGLIVEQGSIVVYWRVDSASLAKLMFIGSDSVGNAASKIEAKDAALNYTSETYRDGTAVSAIASPAGAVFYDELPLRVRTIDWLKPEGEFEVPLAPSLARFKPEKVEFAPARLSWKTAEKSIEVAVKHTMGSDRFVLDREFPFLLREWQMADGSRLKMKRGLKADYWNYMKEGDRERALKNPMLEHPD
jgi:hypothetical protein